MQTELSKLLKALSLFALTQKTRVSSEPCASEREKFSTWTWQAQHILYSQNHPIDCSRVPILLCSTKVNKFQGSGSRLFYLGRCLTEGLNAGRAVVLSDELLSTHDLLSPFKAWSNCTLYDLKKLRKGSQVKKYYPMESTSLSKSADMPAVGALYPQLFEDRGYWWWKAQEITYALRPKFKTTEILKKRFSDKLSNMVVFQIRRTDKTEGCAFVYGKKSGIKCKSEARSPKLLEYLQALEEFKFRTAEFIQVVTDDVGIHKEILETPTSSHVFLEPEPAPKRIPDKDGKGGIFKDRAVKDAIDILTMSYGNPLIFTYSSGFGALALQIKQVRDNFCCDWVSLDWGKREWPPIGTLTEGGVRGVKANTTLVSNICGIRESLKDEITYKNQYCSLYLKKSSREVGAAIFTFCNCNKSLESS